MTAEIHASESTHTFISYPTTVLLLLVFQAEDGIRDIGVTGVQTCALPIWLGGVDRDGDLVGRALDVDARHAGVGQPLADQVADREVLEEEALVVALGEPLRLPRSAERRVGKECRSRWSPSH